MLESVTLFTIGLFLLIGIVYLSGLFQLTIRKEINTDVIIKKGTMSVPFLIFSGIYFAYYSVVIYLLTDTYYFRGWNWLIVSINSAGDLVIAGFFFVMAVALYVQNNDYNEMFYRIIRDEQMKKIKMFLKKMLLCMLPFIVLFAYGLITIASSFIIITQIFINKRLYVQFGFWFYLMPPILIIALIILFCILLTIYCVTKYVLDKFILKRNRYIYIA